MRFDTAGAAPVPFRGLHGRALVRLLQLPFVRYHRVQLGFVERPRQYRRFLTDVLGPRLDAIGGRIGVFGVGAHTELLRTALPGFAERIHCFTDNNATLWHQTRFGKTVLPPAGAVEQCDAFLLSTTVFQRVLTADLRRLGFAGPVLAIDDDVPAPWFLGEDDV
ncbi:MAG: hypothetical protein IT184_14815 [Acidobacteria bacterium]|nr:hypothetical protein [Acidobacteriota bacterium]